MRRYKPGDDGRHLSFPTARAAKGTQPATVPGTVLTSLVDNKQIDDPYIGQNQDTITDAYEAGIGLYTYWFMCPFRLPKPLPRNGRVFLAFRGINYSADFYLNGHQLTATQPVDPDPVEGCRPVTLPPAGYETPPPFKGMFLRRRFDVTDKIRTQNSLAVLVTPPNPPGNPNSDAAGNDVPSRWEPSVSQGGDGTLGQSVTAQFSGGWDFNLVLPDRNAGIWDQVELVITGPVIFNIDPQITTTNIHWDTVTDPAGQNAEADVTASVHLTNLSLEAVDAQVQLEIGGIAKTSSLVVAPGESLDHAVMLHMDQAALWWPNGHGSQTLYPATVRVFADGSLSQVYQCRIGVRTIFSKPGPNLPHVPSSGRIFTVNERDIFVRGGAWTFPDAMLRHSAQDYDDQVHMHQLANLNMIRIWGGGIIERPEFYDACDKYGILVWQEFPISEDGKDPNQWNRTTPHPAGNPKDFELFRQCAADAICMLRNHASLAIWVGGNEGVPPPSPAPLDARGDLDDQLECLVGKLDPKTNYVSFSTQVAEGFGRYDADGPYDIKEPSNWFKFNKSGAHGGLRGNTNTISFNPEYGSVFLPVEESIRRFIPEEDLNLDQVLFESNWAFIPPRSQNPNWKGDLNRSWELHHFAPFFSGPDDRDPETGKPLFVPGNKYKNFSYNEGFNTTDQLMLYGEPRDFALPQQFTWFCNQAQAAQHQQYKAIFEALNAGMWWFYTGGILWRSACGWAGLKGGLYDRYLEPTAGLFGVRQACAPVNVQVNLSTFAVDVVNNTPDQIPAGVLSVTFCDEDGMLTEGPDDIDTLAIGPFKVMPVAQLGRVTDEPPGWIDTSKLQVVRTTLTNRITGEVIATNLDWIADTSVDMWDRSVDPTPPYGKLRDLPGVVLTASGSGTRDKHGNFTATLEIGNEQNTLAFFNRIRVWQPGMKALVQPVFPTDNFFTLLPDDRVSIELTFRMPNSRATPVITISGWNSSPGTHKDIIPIKWKKV